MHKYKCKNLNFTIKAKKNNKKVNYVQTWLTLDGK